MSTIVVFVVGFALAGGFYVWLLRLGKRMQAKAQAQVSTVEDGDGGDAIAENAGFAAEMVEKLARRRSHRSTDDSGNDSGSDGGGDGG